VLVLVSLLIPNLKAILVESKSSPIVRRYSHRHLLIRLNGLAAAVAVLSDTVPVAEFDRVCSRHAAIVGPLSDQLTEKYRVHAGKQLDPIALPDGIVTLPVISTG
jgi:hypothetical protein